MKIPSEGLQVSVGIGGGVSGEGRESVHSIDPMDQVLVLLQVEWRECRRGSGAARRKWYQKEGIAVLRDVHVLALLGLSHSIASSLSVNRPSRWRLY